MNLHMIGEMLGKTVEELGDLPVSSYYKWVAYVNEKQRRERSAARRAQRGR